MIQFSETFNLLQLLTCALLFKSYYARHKEVLWQAEFVLIMYKVHGSSLLTRLKYSIMSHHEPTGADVVGIFMARVIDIDSLSGRQQQSSQHRENR